MLDSPAQLRSLRAAVFQALTGRPSPADASLDDVPEKMVVVATELATNALRHGLPPARDPPMTWPARQRDQPTTWRAGLR